MEVSSKSKSKKDFYIILAIVLLCYLLSINTDLQEFSQHREINIPANFFFLTLGTDVLVIISWFLILFYKKIGIFLLPIFIIVHFVLHNYFLSTYLYSDVTALFLFIGLGLVAIIPRWDEMK